MKNEPLKILAIGNSFSQDGTRYLEEIDRNLFVRNMYIPGCSLEQHYNNLKEDNKAYRYEKDAAPITEGELISIKDALIKEDWDIITVQQVSGLSGIIDTYEPYLTELLNYIKEYRPNAKIYFHETWAYDYNSWHPDFPKYDKDPLKMDMMIKEAVDTTIKNHNLECIRCGEFIHYLRENKILYGESLYRDQFHLSFQYGRFALSLVWDYTLTGNYTDIIPEELPDKELGLKIINAFKNYTSSI